MARRISSILEKHISRESATIHIDGVPSRQKAKERADRKSVLDKRLEELRQKVESTGPRTERSPTSFLRGHTVIKNTAEGLVRLGWGVCECPFQPDTHITGLIKDSPCEEDVAVMTSDSDFMVYEDITSIVMPLGRS